MRKIYVIAAMAAAVALSSCTKEPSVESSGTQEGKLVPVTFTAVSSETKTTIDESYNVVWTEGDKIAVFANGNKYTFTAANGGATASFVGEMTEADLASASFTAVYPDGDDVSINDDGTVKTVIANSQYERTGTFANGMNVSVAKSTDLKLSFKNVCCLVRIEVPESMTQGDNPLAQFMLSANGGEALAGTVNITVSDEPTVSVVEKKTDVIVVNKEGLSAGTYYLSVLPVESLSKGLRVKQIYKDNSSEYIFSGKVVALERSKVFKFGTLRPAPSYVFLDCESLEGLPAYITGNTNALSIIDNPCKTDTNPSSKVLANDMHTATWATSGYVQITFTSDEVKDVPVCGSRQVQGHQVQDMDRCQ